MHPTIRYALPIVAAISIITGAAYLVARETSRSWFEDDVRLRAENAIRGAQEVLSKRWAEGDRDGVLKILSDITHDERIPAAAACAPDGKWFTQTPGVPVEVSCARLIAGALKHGPKHIWNPIDHIANGFWNPIDHIANGGVYLSAFPILSPAGTPLGTVGLIHDMHFIEQRDAVTRRAAYWLFAAMILGALLLSTGIARASWWRFTRELRALVKSGKQRPEFQPLLKDVRELASRLAAESRSENRAWTPERLREVLHEHLQGEKVILLANREPYIHSRDARGKARVLHPASGLVTALEPVMRACSGVWVAHGSGDADREFSDERGRVKVPPGEESYTIRRVWLSEEEERGYYYGFSNEGLWPLCHMAHARPTFRDADFEHYRRVNERFAQAVVDEADREDPIILVQDYHFALVPKLIREKLPRATILAFWHIPWPNAEQFGICPFREEILEGLLGSSIVGFHTQAHCNNFVDAVDRYIEARIDRETIAVVHGGDSTLVRSYPISIEWPNRWTQQAPPNAECRKHVFAELGLSRNALLGVGVDRLDYTKGIEERLLAVEQLLERFPQYRGRFTFVQLAAPSRTAIERYRQLDDRVQEVAEKINARFGRGAYQPIILMKQHHEPPRVFEYLRAADVCYVSSLHDGMNLVAKEFVAAREDERGVLLLSQFTGAAKELAEALIVNPYDLKEASSALAAALRMTVQEQAERMRALRALVSEFNVYRWAGRMLADSVRLRQKDRLSHKLGAGIDGGEHVAAKGAA
jgi:trehalose 6-phosphate synthase